MKKEIKEMKKQFRELYFKKLTKKWRNVKNETMD